MENELKLKTITKKNNSEVINAVNDFVQKNWFVIINISVFYDTISENHLAKIFYYE